MQGMLAEYLHGFCNVASLIHLHFQKYETNMDELVVLRPLLLLLHTASTTTLPENCWGVHHV